MRTALGMLQAQLCAPPRVRDEIDDVLEGRSA
jgi:hypothetical protein